MRRPGVRLVFAIATLVTACNGLVGNESVSVWEPEAGTFDATTRDAGESVGTPDASATPGDADAAPSDDGSGTTPPLVGIAVEIVSNYSGTCVDVGSTKQSGSVLSLTVCEKLAEQLLVLRSLGASYSIFNPNSGKCVSVQEEDGGVPNGTRLELQECGDASAQLFEVKGTTGAYLFISRAGGLCLDDAAFGASSGAPVVVYSCNSGTNQQWSLAQ
jgi:hypothetical protein